MHHIDHCRGCARTGKFLNHAGKSPHPFALAADLLWQAETIETCVRQRLHAFGRKTRLPINIGGIG
jgi:hypothetical protein